MSNAIKILSAAALVALLGACGSSDFDRTVSGAGIGAGAGAVVGALTPLSVGTGALIGAGAGGATGLFTDSDQIDLGRPLWK